MAPEDQYFDSDGVRIRYIVQGTGEPISLGCSLTDDIEENSIDTDVFASIRGLRQLGDGGTTLINGDRHLCPSFCRMFLSR